MTHRPTRIVPWVLAAALFLAAPAAVPDDGLAALQYFEQREATALKDCAAKLWEAAESARKQGFGQLAAETADRILADYDPEHKGARELLGWTKKGKAWEHNPADAAPRTNT